MCRRPATITDDGYGRLQTTERGRPNSEEKALDLFAEMMIEKIESINEDWRKPWFTEGALQWPRNLSGREYNGMNAFMLMLHCEKEGYKIPRFCTFDCVQRMNKPGKDGQELPRVSVLRGEKSFPVMLTTFTCIHKETKEKIKYDDYKNLSEDEKKEYNVYPRMQVFRVFNVQQTNLREARPELWEKLEKENGRPEVKAGEQFDFEPVDRMISENLWICPIRPMHQDSAYYSITKNEIVVPEKRQFKDGEAFYGTLFHEMTHSTGAKGVLDRLRTDSLRFKGICQGGTGGRTRQRIGLTALRHDQTHQGRLLRLPQIMARLIERVPAVHQDNPDGCKKGILYNHAEGGQDCKGTGRRQYGTDSKRDLSKGKDILCVRGLPANHR